MHLNSAIPNIVKLYSLISMGYKKYKYSKFEQDHVFNIEVDNMKFKLTFGPYKLDPAIIERIEGRREPETTAVLKSLIKHGDKVLELGGCYGYFTTIMSICAGNCGKIITIEGTPNNYTILTKNIKLNNLDNVVAYNVFVTSIRNEVTFGKCDRNPYEAIERLNYHNSQTKGDTVAIPAIKLSKFLEKIDFFPDYIFMDIEGFEVDVFEDLSINYLKKYKPIIMFEMHPQFYKNNMDLSFIIQILIDNGYYFRFIADNCLCMPNLHR